MRERESQTGREKCLEWEVLAIQSPDSVECERGDQCGISDIHTLKHTHIHSECQMFFSQWGRNGLVSSGQPCVSLSLSLTQTHTHTHTHAHTHTPHIHTNTHRTHTELRFGLFSSHQLPFLATFTVHVCQNSQFYQWRVHHLQLRVPIRFKKIKYISNTAIETTVTGTSSQNLLQQQLKPIKWVFWWQNSTDQEGDTHTNRGQRSRSATKMHNWSW